MKPVSRCLAVILLLLTWTQDGAAAELELVPQGSAWKYWDLGGSPGAGWNLPAFNDTGWPSGAAQLGYGEGDEATVVGFGPDPANKFVTTYFRHDFQASNPGSVQFLDLRLMRDDAAAVYLNGQEILRSNLPLGPLSPTTLASSTVGSADEHKFLEAAINPALLVSGTNVIAVEVHQAGVSSSDVSFDLELVGADASTPLVTRGPYLQLGTENAITVRWRTNVPHASRLRYSVPSGTALTEIADDPTPKTEHAIRIPGMLPGQATRYAVGTTSQTLAGGTSEHHAVGSFASGSPRRTRIWVLGDSGTGNSTAAAVRDAFLAWNNGIRPDFWLMLGDNAYLDGTDQEFQTKLFDFFPTVLRNSVLWPAFGNHDAVASNSASESGPYFDAFDLPRNGEAGGFPSGTEAYYSFDAGDVHFIVLDSQGSSMQPFAPMANWLRSDLAAHSQRWTVAYWHHPPYSKGSHDSDLSLNETLVRTHLVPILEQNGVDLVLSGHSHSYERSALLDGHYGLSATLLPSMVLDGGDGDPNGDGAYRKNAAGGEAHRGAVYVVLGNSGSVTAAPLDHPVMVRNLVVPGSLVLDVEGGRLEGRLLDSAGVIRDHFAIEKETACNDGLDNDGDGPADFPHDPNCAAPTAVSESRQCQDGFDNDGDGDADFPNDSHCGSPVAASEFPQCSDGLDNDGDGRIDHASTGSLTPDADCTSQLDDREASVACGLGAEAAISLALLRLLRVRRKRAP